MADINLGIVDGGSDANVYSPDANQKSVSRFQNVSGITVPICRVVAKFSTSYTEAKVKAIIYSDNDGSPGSLLAVSDERNIAFTDFTTEFTFQTPCPIENNSYVWIGFISDTSIFNSFGDSTRSMVYNSNTYASGPTENFGSYTSEAKGHRILAIGDDGQSRFGRSSVDAATGVYQQDREHGDKFTLGGSVDVDVLSISTYIRTTSATVKSKAAIYTDNSGAPWTKISQTQEVTGSTAASWLELEFESPVRISPGVYWLLFICDEDLDTNVIGVSGSIKVDGIVNESNAWPETITFLYDSPPNGIDIYATYQVVSGGGGGSLDSPVICFLGL